MGGAPADRGWVHAGRSLIMGVAVSGMHYTGMAAMHVYSPAGPGMLTAMSGGVSAAAFLLPLIIGISLLASAAHRGHLTVAHRGGDPEDAALMARITGRAAEAAGPVQQPPRSGRTTRKPAAGSGPVFLTPSAAPPAGHDPGVMKLLVLNAQAVYELLPYAECAQLVRDGLAARPAARSTSHCAPCSGRPQEIGLMVLMPRAPGRTRPTA